MCQHPREVQRCGLAVPCLRNEEVRASDDLVQAPEAHLREDPADVLGHEPPVVDDVLGPGVEPRPALRVLCGYPHRACVGLAPPAHHASHCDHRRRSESEILRAEQCGHYDVPGGLELTVDLQADAAAEVVDLEGLLDLRETGLPWRPGVPDGRERTCAGAPVASGDEDDIRPGLCHSGGDRSDAGLGDQLHAYPGPGVDALEVEYELLQVLY